MRVSRALLIPVLVSILACDDEDVLKPDPVVDPYLAPTSPENVFENFQRAHRHQDADAYGRCFADTYSFHVTNDDRDFELQQMDQAQEIAVARAMFDAADSVAADWVGAGDVPSVLPEYPPGDGYRTITVAPIRMHTREFYNGPRGPVPAHTWANFKWGFSRHMPSHPGSRSR